MATGQEVGPRLGVAPTCAALGVSAASYYRRCKPQPAAVAARPSPPRTLPAAERTAVVDILHEPRFVDLAPAQVYAGRLDEGRYVCSQRTMYRILEANQEVRERRDQLRHPSYAAPQLLATGPNQLWSWDITKLLGPAKWTYCYLYVILDVFSRYVVGWMVAHRESATLAEKLIREIWCARRSLAVLVIWKEVTLLIARSTDSQPSARRSDATGEASGGEPASRSASEPVSTSLHKVKVASLPDVLKPATGGEVTGVSNRRAFRGERGQRAGTERPRNLGDPAQQGVRNARRRTERHNRACGCGRESERLIVARKRVTTVERRGRSHCELMSEER
jgi:transposase InsO family protein